MAHVSGSPLCFWVLRFSLYSLYILRNPKAHQPILSSFLSPRRRLLLTDPIVARAPSPSVSSQRSVRVFSVESRDSGRFSSFLVDFRAHRRIPIRLRCGIQAVA